MSNVNTILARKGNKSISIHPDATVLEALELMAEKNIGSVIVEQEDKYLGIFTERDYSRKVILKNKHSANTKVSEVMSNDMPAVTLSDTTEKCMELMSDKNVRYLPVFEKEELKGVISISDVVKEILLQQKETINHLQNYIQG